jgi:hypothetical protein
VCRGVLPLPLSALKSASPVLRNPLNRARAITLSFDQFRYGWTNAIESDDEAKGLYQEVHVAGSGVTKIPNRGHSLIIDHGWREVAQTALDFVKRFEAAAASESSSSGSADPMTVDPVSPTTH